MSDYIYDSNTGELYHYGVKGMKWGIRRGKQTLYGGTKGSHNNGVAILSGHRDKIIKKINKLDAKNEKLEKTRDKQIQKGDVKAAKLERKAAKLEKKSIRKFRSMKKRQKLQAKANIKHIKARELETKSEVTRAKIEKNKALKKAFQKGLNEINRELVTKGQDFIYMRSNGHPYTLADPYDPPED